MNEFETKETSVVTMEEGLDAGETEAAAVESTEVLPAELMAEAEALKAVYPDFDLTAEMEDPVMGSLLRGEGKPTLRQLYEAVHMEEISAERVRAAVETAVAEAVASAASEAVAEAVKDSEERLLGHIRARGQRPAENGIHAAEGIRMHPAVGRLTRRERAMLAKRAEDGEHIRL